VSDTIYNPYEQAGRWFKGNIHVHGIEANDGSANGFDGTHGDTPENIYLASCEPPYNFDFLCIAIHVYASGVGLFGRAPDHQRIVGIPARQIQNDRVFDGRYGGGYFQGSGAKFLHVLTIGEDDGVSICCHPLFFECAKPSPGGEWRNTRQALLEPCDRLKALNVGGIEVFNGLTLMEDTARGGSYRERFGEACWDELLQAGHRYFGFAGNDEFFQPSAGYEAFRPLGYILVSAVTRSRTAILNAIKAGRFYSSSGVALADSPLRVVHRNSSTSITVSAAERVEWSAYVHERQGAVGPQPLLCIRHAGLDVRAERRFEIRPLSGTGSRRTVAKGLVTTDLRRQIGRSATIEGASFASPDIAWGSRVIAKVAGRTSAVRARPHAISSLVLLL
jgi:hypothetical protein